MGRRRPVVYRPLTGRLFGSFEAASIKWEILIAILRCLSDCVFAYYARSSVRSCRRRWNRDKMAGDGTHNNTMQLCIYVLPVPPASAPCARRVAGGLSTRCAINLITGDTFWEPVIGRKPVNRLTGYRYTSLICTLTEFGSVEIMCRAGMGQLFDSGHASVTAEIQL